MTPLTDDELRAIVQSVAAHLPPPAPDWTDRTDSDPGIALLQLMAFLAETLAYRGGALGDRAEPFIAEINDWLNRLRPAGGESVGPVRVRFFDGQLLTAADFEAEQTYHRTQHRLHNLRLHGSGIVGGLEVTLVPGTSADDHHVSIAPGCAITPLGDEVILDATTTCPLPAPRHSGFITLTFTERGIAPVPVTTDDDSQPTRVKEGSAAAFAATPAPGAVSLARLIVVSGRWQLDPHFQAPRSR